MQANESGLHLLFTANIQTQLPSNPLSRIRRRVVDICRVTIEWNARPKHWDLPKFRRRMHPVASRALFSPIFSLAREKIGPPEARQKRPRRNESLQARLLILCARFFLSKPQTEFAVWVSWQICSNLSVSAAPSQHPYPFCPFGTFPPDRGNRPLEGEPFPARR